MLAANNRLVDSMDGALNVEVNTVSLEEEEQITDMVDMDHEWKFIKTIWLFSELNLKFYSKKLIVQRTEFYKLF